MTATSSHKARAKDCLPQRVQNVFNAQASVNKAVFGLRADKVVNSIQAGIECRKAINELRFAIGKISEKDYRTKKKKLKNLKPS